MKEKKKATTTTGKEGEPNIEKCTAHTKEVDILRMKQGNINCVHL